jgi:hypothetical protein
LTKIPKGQHFIPRLHLQHFAGLRPKGQVWTFDKNTSKARSAIPKETAQQRHFYSAENEDGSYNVDVEAYLSQVESIAAPIYERLLKGHIPNGQARADFAQFLALMYLRTPAMRRDYAALMGRMIHTQNYAWGVHDEAFDSLMRKMEREKGEQYQTDERERFRQALIDPSMHILQIRKEHTLKVLESADKLAPIFFNMHWTLLRVTNGYLITSDHPMTRHAPPEDRHPIYGDGGFAHKKVQVTFPLSPKFMLLMTWQDGITSLVNIGREDVTGLNELRAYYALDFLYCHLNDARIQRLASKFKGSRPRLVSQGFGPEKHGPIEVPRRWPETKKPG